jgi:hypothetical protein
MFLFKYFPWNRRRRINITIPDYLSYKIKHSHIILYPKLTLNRTINILLCTLRSTAILSLAVLERSKNIPVLQITMIAPGWSSLYSDSPRVGEFPVRNRVGARFSAPVYRLSLSSYITFFKINFQVSSHIALGFQVVSFLLVSPLKPWIRYALFLSLIRSRNLVHLVLLHLIFLYHIRLNVVNCNQQFSLSGSKNGVE